MRSGQTESRERRDEQEDERRKKITSEREDVGEFGRINRFGFFAENLRVHIEEKLVFMVLEKC